jgi:hypothetical protein
MSAASIFAISPLLAARDDTVVALVTGNLEPIAWTKMRRLGIYQHFTAPGIGGFGSDHTLRGELVKIAVSQAGGKGRGRSCLHTCSFTCELIRIIAALRYRYTPVEITL